MNPHFQFLKTLSAEHINQILAQWCHYRRTGLLGDGVLRTAAIDYAKFCGENRKQIVLSVWVDNVHHLACEWLATKYLKSTGGYIFEDRDS